MASKRYSYQAGETPEVMSIRFDPQLLRRLRAEAEGNGVSINAQLMYVLRARYLARPDLQDVIDRLGGDQ